MKPPTIKLFVLMSYTEHASLPMHYIKFYHRQAAACVFKMHWAYFFIWCRGTQGLQNSGRDAIKHIVQNSFLLARSQLVFT